MTLPFIDER
jgi:hypothetical protein